MSDAIAILIIVSVVLVLTYRFAIFLEYLDERAAERRQLDRIKSGEIYPEHPLSPRRK